MEEEIPVISNSVGRLTSSYLSASDVSTSDRDTATTASSRSTEDSSSDDSSTVCSSEADTIRRASTGGLSDYGNLTEASKTDASSDSDASSDTASTVSDAPYTHGSIIRKRLLPPQDALARCEDRIKKYCKKNKVDAAMTEYIRCVALSKLEYGAYHWRSASAVANLGQAYLELRGFQHQAFYHAEQARCTILNHQPTSEESQANKTGIMSTMFVIYLTLARSLIESEKPKDAYQNFSKSKKLLNELKSSDSVSKTKCLEWDIKLHNSLARHYEVQEDYKNAHLMYKHALALSQRLYGESSVKLMPLYQNMGKCEQCLGEHRAAIALYEKAHRLAVGENELSHESATAAHLLARAHMISGGQRAEDSAERYLHECLSTFRALHGTRHEKTLKLQDELVRLMVRTKRSSDALSLLKSSVSSKMTVFGEYSQQVADTYKLMGSIHLSWGDLEQAATLMKKCYQVEQVVYGARHKKTQATVNAIDIIMQDSSMSSSQADGTRRPPFTVSTAPLKTCGTSPLV